ncbi:hypothetical protein NX059_004431 [Plenodomus lindquistii]|nr:hypothetical protein NX059_004431 [Plenodomus lindquistii]
MDRTNTHHLTMLTSCATSEFDARVTIEPALPSQSVGATEPCKTETEITTLDYVEKREQSIKHAYFENSVKERLNIPTGYVKIAVLVIRWHQDVDQYAKGHTEEIASLRTLFKDVLRYEYEEKTLGTKRNAQATLNNHISSHINDNSGPHNLLIIVYTGHGRLRGNTNKLQLFAHNDKKTNDESGPYKAEAFWNEAEAPLLTSSTEADVLVILDCCFASAALHKGTNNERRAYDLLAACKAHRTTPRPGEKSFTNAFIKAVYALLGADKSGSFLVKELAEHMDNRDCQPAIHNRLNNEQTGQIILAPLDKFRAQEKEVQFQNRLPERAWIKLHFSLVEPTLSREQLKQLGEKLPDVFEDCHIPLRGINSLDMALNIDPSSSLRAKWRQVAIEAVRRKRISRSESDFDREELPNRKRSCTEESSFLNLPPPAQTPGKPSSGSTRAYTSDSLYDLEATTDGECDAVYIDRV